MMGHRLTRSEAACANAPAAAIGLCTSVSNEDFRIFENIETADYTFPAGAELYRHGEFCPDFFNIVDGWAFTYVLLPDGRRQILDFDLPGAFLGLQPRPDAPMIHGAQCLTPVRACVISKARIYELLRKEPRLMLRLSEVETCQGARAYDHLANIGQRPARERIVHLLVELFYRLKWRLPVKAGEAIYFPLTLPHIGDAVGLTSVHVSRTLSALRDEGICELHRKMLSILDPASMAEIAGFGDQLGDIMVREHHPPAAPPSAPW